MKVVIIIVFLLFVVTIHGHSTNTLEMAHGCWYKDTPVDKMMSRFGQVQGLSTSRNNRFEIGPGFWRSTALSPNITLGNRFTLTWSVPPDGIMITGFFGEPSSPNDINARMDEIFGSRDVWLSLFQSVFDRWGEIVGITYQYVEETTFCDFISLLDCPGVPNVRGDVRIMGHLLDGNFGLLGYNFFPPFGGDMIIDTADIIWQFSPLWLTNTLSHEHGHGLNLLHSCPITSTKLMEPFINVVFDGPQLDDIRGGQNFYGDSYEDNDNIEEATSLGNLTSNMYNKILVPSQASRPISIETRDLNDQDYFSFNVNVKTRITLILANEGEPYVAGPQFGITPENPSGCSQCSSQPSKICPLLFPRSQLDLDFQLLSDDGKVLIGASSADTTQSQNEMIEKILSPGTYFIRVFPAPENLFSNREQLYSIRIFSTESE